jgi:hypothetical protein
MTAEPKSRANKKLRAGSTINASTCLIVYGAPVHGKKKIHGYLDPKQRLYQAGGELTKFVYWKKKGVSFDRSVWTDINQSCIVDTIEMIDHDRNECYKIPLTRAIAHVEVYNEGYGSRVCVPLRLWDRIDASGAILTAGDSE